jgi:hypothetical protein
MKILVAYYSESGNTEKVALAIARATGGEPKRMQELAPQDICSYDLVFFGTPVQATRPAPALSRLLASLPAGGGKAAAAFCTMHLWGGKAVPALIGRQIEATGYHYLGGFCARGWSRLVANIGPRIFNRGRPSAQELDQAADFARRVVSAATQTQTAGDVL